MAYKQIRTSNLTDRVLKDDEVVMVICREAGKVLDAHPEELAGLKRVSNVVELEFRHPDGRSESVLVSRADYEKVFTKEILDEADNIKGRRKGYSPTNGG